MSGTARLCANTVGHWSAIGEPIHSQCSWVNWPIWPWIAQYSPIRIGNWISIGTQPASGLTLCSL